MENNMNTLPTAEEWLSNHKELSVHDVASYDEGGYLGVDERALYTIMVEFAKLHVEATKKEQQIEIDALKKTIQGYQEGIDSLPNWDDVRKIIDLARDYNDGWIHSDEEIIEQIKQSKT